jgi:hypothetical protein
MPRNGILLNVQVPIKRKYVLTPNEALMCWRLGIERNRKNVRARKVDRMYSRNDPLHINIQGIIENMRSVVSLISPLWSLILRVEMQVMIHLMPSCQEDSLLILRPPIVIRHPSW